MVSGRDREVGSSPLARGLLYTWQGGWNSTRIIPARAGFTPSGSREPSRCRDHPRSRGVYSKPIRAGLSSPGSSPLARGLQGMTDVHRAAIRIIPARAGFTPADNNVVDAHMDHPRSRGVYQSSPCSTSPRPGSSPLARGLQFVRDVQPAGLRIIPARAGFTLRFEAFASGSADHPRSRGVYDSRSAIFALWTGSSPLARGLPARRRPRRPPRRIIPARAGFTLLVDGGEHAGGDHPRSRGVYASEPWKTSRSRGSSPLARGLQDGQVPVLAAQGIIPARAGFTGRRRRSQQRHRDHPRSRGVYVRDSARSESGRGSSPLARGLRDDQLVRRHVPGIIPARAGFTHRRRHPTQDARDHPRSRGVYKALAVIGAFIAGSSPLARGLLPPLGHVGVGPRIIPARAGFTRTRRWIAGSRPDHPRSRGVYLTKRAGVEPRLGSSPLARGLQWQVLSPWAGMRIIPARAGFTASTMSPMKASQDHPRSRGVYSSGPGPTSGRPGSSPLARGLPLN